MHFPRHLHKPDGLYVVVQNADQYDAVTANGWADQPSAHVEKPVEVRYAEAINRTPIDFDAASHEDEPPPPKRGRKSKG